MISNREWFLILSEEMYNELNPEVRQNAKYTKAVDVDEWENNKEDATYIKLKKAEKKAKADLSDYLWNKYNK